MSTDRPSIPPSAGRQTEATADAAADTAAVDAAHPPAPAVSPTHRLLWLLACLGAGAVIGSVGHAATGHEGWFFAVPLLLAIGWWRLADPGRCAPGAGRAPPGQA